MSADNMKEVHYCGAVISMQVGFGLLPQATGMPSQVINHIQDYTLHPGARQ